MTRSEIEEKIVDIVNNQKTLPPDAVQPDTPLADLGIDSLDALNIIFEVEEAFGVTVSDETARTMRTPNDIVSAIEELLPT
ncbi:MAG: acyl carrier protein [Acidobacteriota bacterium]